MAKKPKRPGRALKPKEWLPRSAGGVDKVPDGAGLTSGEQDTPFAGTAANNDRRIKDCGAARELFVRLYQENQLRAQSFAQVRNQIEGGRPFNPDDLHAAGEDWRTNVNFNDARAAFLRVATPYWKMVHEVPQTISVKVRLKDPKAPVMNRILAENFDLFLEDWGPDYFLQFSGLASDYVMYGTGLNMYEDEDTARYKWMPSIQVMLPKRTKSSVDTWELFCVKRELTAPELLKHIKNPDVQKAAADAGWNAEMIKKAIIMAAPGPANTRYFDPNYWQDLVVTNDLVIGGVWPPVSVVDMWAKGSEKQGKITHYIFTEKSEVPDYLFTAELKEKDFKRVIGTVLASIGSNGLYHAIKGFGVMNYYYATVINRTKCRMIDSATFGMGMNFQADDDTPKETPPIENYSIVNKFPKGMTQLQWYPQGLQSASELLGILSQNQDENNFTYNEPQKDIAETKTAKQAVILSNIANEMSTASSSIFLSQFGGNVFAEQFRRLCQKSEDPDAKKFKKRCIAAGIPKEFFDRVNSGKDDEIEVTVKCGASPTMSSPAAREQIGQRLMAEILPQPGSNRRAILEFRTASLAGADGVEQFLEPIGVDSDPRARREAIMENADLANGIVLGPPPTNGVDPSDAHVEHADEHLKPLEQIVQAIQQPPQPTAPGQPPPQSPITHGHIIALQLGLAHTGGHLQFLAQSTLEKQQFLQLKARFAAVSAVAQGVIKRLAKAKQDADQSGKPLDAGAVTAAIGQGGQ